MLCVRGKTMHARCEAEAYMFENETLVDLLRFDKVVQARTKDFLKGPVRRAGVQN